LVIKGKKTLDLDLQLSSMLPFVASPLTSSRTGMAAKHSGAAHAVAAGAATACFMDRALPELHLLQGHYLLHHHQMRCLLQLPSYPDKQETKCFHIFI
jgi:hypothetical protein